MLGYEIMTNDEDPRRRMQVRMRSESQFRVVSSLRHAYSSFVISTSHGYFATRHDNRLMTDHDTKILAGVRSGDEAGSGRVSAGKRASLLAFIRSRMWARSWARRSSRRTSAGSLDGGGAHAQETDLSNWDPLNWLFHICERKIIDAHRRHFASQKRDARREAALPAGSDAAGSPTYWPPA